MPRKKMTQVEVGCGIQRLALHFDIRVPNLRWSTVYRKGHAHYNKYTIGMGPHAWKGRTEATMVHEFAHFLAFNRDPNTRTAKRWIHHGREFKRALLDVATVWYGDYRKHPWHKERPRTRKGII